MNNSPQCLADFIGQENAKAQVHTAILKAKHFGVPLASILIAGKSGFGKSTFCQLVAQEAGVEFDSMIWPPKNEALLARRLAGAHGVLLLDEIHRGSTNTGEWLLAPLGKDPVAQFPKYTVALDDLTIIAATTDIQMVSAPLRRRFMLQLTFRDYSEAEMAQVMAGMLERSGLSMPESEVKRLAFACGGKPGTAEHLVEAAVGLSIEHDVTTDANAIFEHLEMDDDGLEYLHREYLLKMLEEMSPYCALDTMANVLDLPVGGVKDIERLLKHHALIEYSGQGRTFTQAGRDRADAIAKGL